MIVQALTGRGLPPAGRLALVFGDLDGLTVANALSAPLSAVASEDQEGGEDGEEQPCTGREGASDAEGEGYHAAIPTRVRSQP